MTKQRLMLAAAGCGAAMMFHPLAARADEAACHSLTAAGLFADTRVASAAMVNAQGVAFCEVKATISPVPGSKIGVVYRLPEGWNGRVLGIGGGGWQGNVTIEAAAQGLQKGYATLQTDGGHESNGVTFDSSWARDNPVAVTDFSHRAVHLMTTVGKTVVGRYYAKPLDLAVFQGCSTGGRMALMEAQRYPTDYNAIIAGAPVFTMQGQSAGIVRKRLFTTEKTALTDAQIQRVNQAALAACDMIDGVKDGVITDPRACRWDPSAIQCKPGQAAADVCLTAEQAGAVRRAYANTLTNDGMIAAYGLNRGGEAGWGQFIAMRPAAKTANAPGPGSNGLQAFIYGDANFDDTKFDPAKDSAKLHATPFAKEYEATNPDIRPFLAQGGKLLIYHGFDDPGPSPYSTAAYYDQVKQTTGADSAVRLFIAPGMYHCRGGPGANTFDVLTSMESWETTNHAPETILAANAAAGFTRPLCAWPALAFYKGEGNPNDAASFACRPAGTRTASAAPPKAAVSN